MHLPAISIPVFRGPAGLPVGALVVGKRSRDRDLLSDADWVHRALG